SQTYTLDRASRVVRDTDALGVVREITFDRLGNVSGRSCRGDTASYNYGTTNHQKSQLVSMDVKGSQSYHRAIEYDGFGEIRQVTVSAPDSSTLLDTIYLRDHLQRLQSLKSMSALDSDLNVSREFQYDGFGQVIQESTKGLTTSVTKYVYDGNFNVLSIEVDGNVTSMAYNEIDQRIDPGFKYDMNGRLISDAEGRLFSFDDHDRLITVQTASDSGSKFSYHADDTLAQHHSGSSSSKLYHNHEVINAIEVTKQQGQSSSTSIFADDYQLIANYTDSAS